MKKSLTTHIYSQGLKLLGVFLFCLASQQVFASQSSVIVSCTDPHDTNTCSISGDGDASLALVTFAADLIQTAQNPLTLAEGCYDNGNDITCNLNENPNQSPVNMTCTKGTGTLNCSLDSARTAFTIDCDSNSTLKTCTIATDTKELTDKLTSSITNPNLLALAGSLVTCLNRNTFDESSNGGTYDGGGQALIEGGGGETALPYTANPSSLQDTCNQFLYDLDNNPDEAIKLLKSLMPINPSAATDLGVSNMRLAVNTIQSRLSRVRSGVADTNSTNNYQMFANNEWHNSGTLFADSGNMANDANQSINVDKNISEYGKLGFFINASFLNAKQTDDSIELKSKARSSVLTLGVDYRFTDNIIGGLAFNLSQASTNFDSSGGYTKGSLDDNGFSVLLYSSIYSGNWFFDSALTLGGENYKQTRDPLSVANSFSANFHGDLFSAAATAGYDFTFSSFGITPFAQLTIGNMGIDGYTETASNSGGPGTALSLDAQTKDIGTLNIGSHFRYTIATQNGVFIPTVSLTWVNDFKDEAQTISGRFVANTDPSSSFQLQTSALDTSYFIIATGFSFQLKGGNAGFVNIESVQGYDNLSQQRITAGWRWEI